MEMLKSLFTSYSQVAAPHCTWCSNSQHPRGVLAKVNTLTIWPRWQPSIPTSQKTRSTSVQHIKMAFRHLFETTCFYLAANG